MQNLIDTIDRRIVQSQHLWGESKNEEMRILHKGYRKGLREALKEILSYKDFIEGSKK